MKLKPEELRSILLYAPRTEENSKRIPSEAVGVWWSRPSEEEKNNGMTMMYIRVALIVLSSIYVFSVWSEAGLARVFPLILVSYEIAYQTVWKEKVHLTTVLANERFGRTVDELLAELYPGYAD